MSDSFLLKPDRSFVDRVVGSGGGSLKKCFQCATCSVVCELAPDSRPFPRKEMIWAQWGLKERLLADVDVWLCHQCNDCSTHCPRGAHPADVLAAIRRQSVLHFAVPRFLARWVDQPKYLPLVLGIPVLLLGLLVAAPLEEGRGISNHQKVVYSCWNQLPHWVLISFFAGFGVLALLAMITGVVRFWRAMVAADQGNGTARPANGLLRSVGSVLKDVFTHEKFTICTTDRSRWLAHFGVFYGFLALSVVAVWVLIVVLTAGYNPLVRGGFAYPFNFWNPWRMLANLGGLVLVAGCLLMIWDRLKKSEDGRTSSSFDWTFLGILLVAALTGLTAEALHYARMEPHRLAAYFIHLVAVFMLLMYLPYSKFAHLVYRTTAMVYAEYSGRNTAAPPGPAGRDPKNEKAGQDEAKKDEQ